MNIQDIPLSRRRLFLTGPPGIADSAPGGIYEAPGNALFPAAAPPGASLKRTVSVYSADPSPNRKPQLRQNRNSLGIGEWQFAQFVIVGSICGFIDISISGARLILQRLKRKPGQASIRQTVLCGCIAFPCGEFTSIVDLQTTLNLRVRCFRWLCSVARLMLADRVLEPFFGR